MGNIFLTKKKTQIKMGDKTFTDTLKDHQGKIIGAVVLGAFAGLALWWVNKEPTETDTKHNAKLQKIENTATSNAEEKKINESCWTFCHTSVINLIVFFLFVPLRCI